MIFWKNLSSLIDGALEHFKNHYCFKNLFKNNFIFLRCLKNIWISHIDGVLKNSNNPFRAIHYLKNMKWLILNEKKSKFIGTAENSHVDGALKNISK